VEAGAAGFEHSEFDVALQIEQARLTPGSVTPR